MMTDATYSERNRMGCFRSLSPEEQALAIRRLAAGGMREYDIAAATQLSVECVRRVLEPVGKEGANG